MLKTSPEQSLTEFKTGTEFTRKLSTKFDKGHKTTYKMIETIPITTFSEPSGPSMLMEQCFSDTPGRLIIISQ